MVVINATDETQTLTVAELARQRLELHPVQEKSDDRTVRRARFKESTGTFTVPARTAAVFVVRRGGRDRDGNDDDHDDDGDHHHRGDRGRD